MKDSSLKIELSDEKGQEECLSAVGMLWGRDSQPTIGIFGWVHDDAGREPGLHKKNVSPRAGLGLGL
jgi:hypothetical protein